MTDEERKAIKREAALSWIALIVSILCLIPSAIVLISKI